ncbi:hypothetical protein QFC22_003821 [Naganishia vaughanmartiniae]|uniref:Uncharacterized protein n=1 Tax=Naganishia vaughanmartiniae TaxID=1424756 RepID=A0ACC2X6B9_9TREE|nr:hypothetical protein QFC22_003821 [Naganishia vaughanmartiniae]
MSDWITLIIAIASLVPLCIAVLFAYFYSSGKSLQPEEETPRQLETAQPLDLKYRIPLSLAARELADQLGNIIHRSLVEVAHGTPVQHDAFFLFTMFTFGQYLYWVRIIQLDLQSLMIERTAKQGHPLHELLNIISQHLLEHNDELPFTLYRTHQLAIGEIMSEKQPDGTLTCRSYTNFVYRYNTEYCHNNFRKWFLPIEGGLNALVEAHERKLPPPHERLIKLQGHLKCLQEVLKTEA